MHVIEIHNLNKEYINKIKKLNYEETLLTFDDGLYSQFVFRNELKEYKKIFFISSSLIWNKSNKEQIVDIDCFHAMPLIKIHNDNSAYMVIEQVQQMLKEGFDIQAHSHDHMILKYDTTLSEHLRLQLNERMQKSYLSMKGINYQREDTVKMLNWFKKNLNIKPYKYCFPFNSYTDGFIEVLKEFGFTKFYGKNRIKVENL